MKKDFSYLLRTMRPGCRNRLELIERLRAEADEYKESSPEISEELQQMADSIEADLPNGYDAQTEQWLSVG